MNWEQLSFLGDTREPAKKEKIKTVISASRRTDIPAFHYEWLQDALKKKAAEITNPVFPSKIYKVDLSPENVHSIVLWSKDFRKVARDPGLLSSYNLYFEYTINHYGRLLEPNVPGYDSTQKTLELLLKRYRPEQFNIRFDPVIISTKGEPIPAPEDPPRARLKVFEQLCRDIKCLALEKCRVTTSYISFYGHVQDRLRRCGVDAVNLDEKEKTEFFERLAEIADKYTVNLYSCANPLLESVKGIKAGHCIDGSLLMSLFGGKVSLQKDKGQRTDCKCTLSKDIGSYSNSGNAMECRHYCRYCYVR